MAIILTVIHFKYIVQAACAFTPIEAYKAAFATNCFFVLFFWGGGVPLFPSTCANIALILLG